MGEAPVMLLLVQGSSVKLYKTTLGLSCIMKVSGTYGLDRCARTGNLHFIFLSGQNVPKLIHLILKVQLVFRIHQGGYGG